MTLGPAGLRLLAVLQRDARASKADLARVAGLSASACWRRMRGLEEEGVIRRYAAVLDAGACGLEFHAIALIVLSRHAPEGVREFTAAMAAHPEITDCFAVTGDADYHLRVVCKDKAAYNRFLEEVLFRLPAVATVRTSLILREVKQNAPLDPGPG